MAAVQFLVDATATMNAQRNRRDAMRSLVPVTPKPRKPKARITQADVTAAVNAALSAVAFELRAHKNDLPRWSQAMDFAIATVLKHKGPQA